MAVRADDLSDYTVYLDNGFRWWLNKLLTDGVLSNLLVDWVHPKPVVRRELEYFVAHEQWVEPFV